MRYDRVIKKPFHGRRLLRQALVLLPLSLAVCLLVTSNMASAQRIMERLDRGVVAVQREDGSVYIGWRLLGSDPEDVAFNLYRITSTVEEEWETIRLNERPIVESTNFVDKFGREGDFYEVRPVVDGVEKNEDEPVRILPKKYLTIPLRTPEGYAPNDASVGDLDGDGDYEIVLHQAGRSSDNSRTGFTDPPILQAYRLDGTPLLEINLGKNIREGAHYTQFIVYDLNSDGRAEIVCKTADGTKNGKMGEVIGEPYADHRNTEGRILTGPEYLTVFDGLTGRPLHTVDYEPGRGDLAGWGGVGGNGGNDSIGNRADRFLACVAYLDGRHPSLVMCRGYYGRSVLAAWDFRDGRLTKRWTFDTNDDGLLPYAGQGNHNLSVADVDDDGRDEILYGAMAVDDDGSPLFTTGLRHGDAMHVSDLDPSRPGLEIWAAHENETRRTGPGLALLDARTGEILFSADDGRDVGRCLAADIDPRHPGAELWGGRSGLMTCRGEPIDDLRPTSTNFAIWWDADPLRELLNGNTIDKPGVGRLLTAEGCVSNNGTKSTPVLSADLFGDWREEVVFRTRDNQSLRIYTTTEPTDRRITTLMHDPQYRLSIAWQNVAYNQPPHPSFFIGDGMSDPPRPTIDLSTIGSSVE
jgi:rhamnogalacturonan endolyase